MKRFITLTFAAFAAAFLIGGFATEAIAGKRCQANDIVCDAFNEAEQSYGEVCVHVKARGASSLSALVLYEGTYRGKGRATNVIKTWSKDGWFQRGNGWYKKICLDGDLIADLEVVTVCGIDGHNTWSRRDIKHLLRMRTIGTNDPAKLYASGGM